MIKKTNKEKVVQPWSKDLRKKKGRPKTQQPVTKCRIKKIMSFLLPYIISGAIGALIAFIFFKLGPSKKDLVPIAQNVTEIGRELKQLRQDYLSNDDYKKYLDLYQTLYKSLLESSFPGGYLTFGIREDAVFNTGSFSNDKIEVDVDGTISIKDKDCIVNIFVRRIYFEETQNSFGGFNLAVNIKDYELGRKYSAINLTTATGWKQYIVILNDDLINPVFVYGFAK